jgi:hypothetical protein
VTVSVLVPWRPSPDRRRVWAFLQSRWAQRYPDWQVVVGETTDGPWCKATAVSDALSRADGDVLVVADADVWTDGAGEAVRHVQSGAAWAVPHWRVCRLDKPSTEAVLAGAPLGIGHGYDRKPYMGRRGGGMVVLSRTLYDAVPLDARYLGWGREDDSWALALRALAGKEWRGLEDLWHLHHRPQKQPGNGRGSADSEALYRRYVAAKTDPDAMRSLLDETRAVV